MMIVIKFFYYVSSANHFSLVHSSIGWKSFKPGRNFYCFSTTYVFSLQLFLEKCLQFELNKYTFAPAFKKGHFLDVSNWILDI